MKAKEIFSIPNIYPYVLHFTDPVFIMFIMLRSPGFIIWQRLLFDLRIDRLCG